MGFDRELAVDAAESAATKFHQTLFATAETTKMIYDTADPIYHSFLTGGGVGVQQKAFAGGGGGQAKGPKARGSDGKYQGE